MPSAPSINCAANPIKMNGIKAAGSARIDGKMAYSIPVQLVGLPNGDGFSKHRDAAAAIPSLVFAPVRT